MLGVVRADNPINFAVLNEDPISLLKLCAQENATLLFAIPRGQGFARTLKEKKKWFFYNCCEKKKIDTGWCSAQLLGR